jgi:ATP-binding cassette subfamily F protein 3
VLVSHDRALLRTVCDSFILVADGRAAEFTGDLDDYLQWLNGRRAGDSASTGAKRGDGRRMNRADRERVDADRQARLARRRPLQREAQKLEGEIAKLERERQDLETRLADPELYARDAAAAQDASKRCGELTRLIGAAEERWLAAQAELDAIDAS